MFRKFFGSISRPAPAAASAPEPAPAPAAASAPAAIRNKSLTAVNKGKVVSPILNKDERSQMRKERRYSARKMQPALSVLGTNDLNPIISNTAFSVLGTNDLNPVISNKSIFNNKQTDITVLDDKLIKKYGRDIARLSAVNQAFRQSTKGILSTDIFPTTDFSNIQTIKLEGLKIIDTIIEILNKIPLSQLSQLSKITTIILRNITFDSVETCTKFLHFLGRNVNIKILILDGVYIDKTNFKIFLDILGTFKQLELLKLSKFNITTSFIVEDYTFDYVFMKTLIKLGQLKFLLFTNNIIEEKIYKYLFNDYNDRSLQYVIDLGKDGIYLKHNLVIQDNNDPLMYIVEIYTKKAREHKKCVYKRSTADTFVPVAPAPAAAQASSQAPVRNTPGVPNYALALASAPVPTFNNNPAHIPELVPIHFVSKGNTTATNRGVKLPDFENTNILVKISEDIDILPSFIEYI